VTEWELVARESIRDLVARYNANGDSGRFDQVIELFALDAVMEIDGATHEGRPAIRQIFEGVAVSLRKPTAPPLLRHHTSTLQIDLDSETAARSRCYFQVLMAHGLDHWGRYIDEFANLDGRWMFTRRVVKTEGMVRGGWAESVEPPR
jgi:hypothetical protein